MEEIEKKIDDIIAIKDDKTLSNEKKLDKLSKIENLDSANNLKKLTGLMKQHIKSSISDIDNRLEAEKENIIKNIANTADATIEEANLKEISAEISEETGIPTIEIEDIIRNQDMPPANDEEKKKIDKVKKIYTYKVEGEIKSGIEDLDRFLAIIKPALDQVIIAPWRVIYGIGDAGEWCFEHYKAYHAKAKEMENSWKTAQYFGLIEDNKKYNYAKGNKKNQQTITDAFHKRWLEKLNNKILEDEAKNQYYEKIEEEIRKNNSNLSEEEIQEKINKKIGQLDLSFKNNIPVPEFDDFKTNNTDKIKKSIKERKNFFDENENPQYAREILIEELLDLYKKLRNPNTGKISDDNMKIIRGYVNTVDLFNKKNSSEFTNNFSKYLGYVFEEDKKKYKDYYPEDISVQQWIGDADESFKKSDELSLFKNIIASQNTK